MHLSAEQIRNNFLDEQSRIGKYVEHVRRTIQIDDADILQINSTLSEAGLPGIAERSRARLWRSFNEDETNILLQSIEEAEPALEDFVNKRSIERFELIDQLEGEAPDRVHMEAVAAWRDHLLDLFLGEPEPPISRWGPLDPTAYLEDLVHSFSIDHRALPPADDVEIQLRRAVIGRGLLEARAIATNRNLRLYNAIINQFDTMRAFAPALAETTSLNLLRQGFLLLTTAFDAAVFDLVRFALRKRFFQLISKFGKSVSLKVDQFEKHAGIDEFQESVIEQKLEGVFVRAILNSLHAIPVKLTETNEETDFHCLIEFLARRNVHVHNRGVVDQGYFEHLGDAKASMSQLPVVGSILPITSQYWDDASDLCRDCVLHVAAWADPENCSLPTGAERPR